MKGKNLRVQGMSRGLLALSATISSLFLLVPLANAIDVETLPAGVRLTQARYGVVSGLDQTWRSNGKLYDLGETHSITFDAATLARVNPRAQKLIEALNYFGTQSLGSRINLGTLDISTKPEVQYYAPVFAYGISNSWTVGLGVPLIHYKNRIGLSASESNLAYYKDQFKNVSQELDDAMNVDLVAEARKVLAEKGYHALESRDEQFIGDVEVHALHRLPNLQSWAFMHQLSLHLPTGPKDDADDLTSLNSFGRTMIGNTLISARSLGSGLAFLPFTSLDVPIPDKVVKRVPRDEDDTLPDASSKRDVSRWIAPTFSLGAELRWSFLDRWELRTGTLGAVKGRDKFDGDGRMDLLSQGTDSTVVRVSSGVSYSTVEDYQRKHAMIPGKITLDISDTVAGRNIERQLLTELSAMIFF
jgi:hypothetical protein